MKRIFLFLITNIAIMLVITIIINIFGLGQVLDEQGVGLDLTSLLMLSAVVGMTGSFISLALSKTMAKHSTGAYVIEQPRNEQEQWLINTVARQAKEAGIGMPEVAIYDSPDINAFATGMMRDSSLVAVSTGLLHGMTRDEAEAVLAHEVSHVANGDMVTSGMRSCRAPLSTMSISTQSGVASIARINVTSSCGALGTASTPCSQASSSIVTSVRKP